MRIGILPVEDRRFGGGVGIWAGLWPPVAMEREKRQAADKRLASLGQPALALLRKAAMEHTDAEVRERATRLVREISRARMPPVRDLCRE